MGKDTVRKETAVGTSLVHLLPENRMNHWERNASALPVLRYWSAHHTVLRLLS